MLNRLCLAALACLAPASAALASFDGMGSANYRSPYNVHDSGGNTQNSAFMRGRASIAVSAQGDAVSSSSYLLYPGYLQHLPDPNSTATPTRTSTPSPTRTRTPSSTATLTSTRTPSPTPTATHTNSPTPTATSTMTQTSTQTPTNTVTSSASPTPFAILSIYKSADQVSVSQGETITYTLISTNSGTVDAFNITVWDTLDPSTGFLASGPPPTSFTAGVLIWQFPSLNAGQASTLVFSVSYPGSGPASVSNRSSMAGLGLSQIDSNVVLIGFGVAFTATPSPTQTVTPSNTPSPTSTLTATPSFTQTVTETDTCTETPTLAQSPTQTLTATGTETPVLSSTDSATSSPSPSFSCTPTISGTPTPTATPTPQAPGLSLAKTAAEAGAFQGSQVNYSIVVSNAGPGIALGVQIYDTLPDGTNFAGPSVVQSDSYAFNDAWRFTDGLSLARGPFDLGVGQSVTVSLIVDVVLGTPGQNLTNTAQAVDAQFGQSAPGSAVIPLLFGAASPTVTPTQSPTLTPGASPSPTPTPAMAAFVVSLVRDQGQAWLGGTDLRFSINVTHTAGAAVSDLVLQFHSDVANQNQFLDFVDPNTLLGPADSMSPVAWRLFTGGIDGGVDMGNLSVASGSSISPRRIFTRVMGGQGTTLTSQVLVSSAAYGISVIATVQTYIYFGPQYTPTPGQIPSGTPTPVASQGRIIAYPQPARDSLCFAYHAPGAGQLTLLIYNAAFQLVGELKEDAVGGQMEAHCYDIRGLAPGVYFYQARVGAFAFPTGQFGIAR